MEKASCSTRGHHVSGQGSEAGVHDAALHRLELIRVLPTPLLVSGWYVTDEPASWRLTWYSLRSEVRSSTHGMAAPLREGPRRKIHLHEWQQCLQKMVYVGDAELLFRLDCFGLCPGEGTAVRVQADRRGRQRLSLTEIDGRSVDLWLAFKRWCAQVFISGLRGSMPMEIMRRGLDRQSSFLTHVHSRQDDYIRQQDATTGGHSSTRRSPRHWVPVERQRNGRCPVRDAS